MKNDDPIPASPPSGDLPSRSGEVATEAVDDSRSGLIYRVMLSAEIKTRQKRVIEFFLDPFRTYLSEGLRER